MSGGSPPPEGATASPPAPRRRPRRWLRWTLLALLATPFLLALALALLLPDRRLERLLADELSRQLGATVSLRLDRRGLGVWEIDSLRIAGDEPDAPFLRLARLGLYARPGTLLGRRLTLDSLVLAGPELGLAWRNGLDLPAWLDSLLAESVAPVPAADSALAGDAAFAWLRPLVDAGLVVDSTRVVIRGARLHLAGVDEGRRVELSSPPLDLALRLPRLEGLELTELAEGRLPSKLLAGALLGWTGAWRDAARQAGEGLRPLPLPPELRAPLSEAGLGLGIREQLAQSLEADFRLAADTLRLQGRATLSPDELDLLFDGDQLPLPATLESRLQLDWPLKADTFRLSGRLDWVLGGPGLSADGGMGFELGRPDSLWRTHVRLTQRASGERLGLWLPPSLAGEGVDGALEMEFAAELELALDESFAPVGGRLDERLELRLPRLDWALQGLRLDTLRLTQRFGARLEVAPDGLWPREPLVEARLELAHAVYEADGLREEVRGVEAALRLSGAGPSDSLDLAADLGLAELLGTRFDCSAGGRLPAPRSLAAQAEIWAEAPERLLELPLWFAVESGRMPLERLDPDLAGRLRLSLSGVAEAGALRLEGEGVPDQVAYLMDGEALPLPLHRVGFSARLLPQPRADGSWTAVVPAWRLEPDPLAPVTGELREETGRARLLFDWPGLDLARLLALTPASLLPEDLPPLQARLALGGEIGLPADWWPDSLRVDADLREGSTTASGYAVDSMEMACTLRWAADSLRFEGAGGLGRVDQEEPAWSWREIGFEFAGGLSLPEDSLLADPSGWVDRPDGRAGLAFEARARAPRLGFDARLEGTAPDWRDPLGLGGTLDWRLDTPGRVEPWPGLQLVAAQGGRVDAQAFGGGLVRVTGLFEGRVDSLAWESSARLEGLEIDLPFRQELSWNLDGDLSWPAPEGRPPLDWNALRAMDRDRPPATLGAAAGFHRGEVRGWALRIAHLSWDEFRVHQFAADLRLADGRLDCPEYRLQAFAGDIKGAFELWDFSEPAYRFELAAVGLDSRHFRFGREAPGEPVARAGRREGRTGARERLDAQLHLEGHGVDLDAVDALEGRLRMPALGREVTLNLLIALDARGVDPSIGRVRKLLELPGFKYRVESLDFTLAHGFVRPQVALKKSPFSPLPDVAVPMSPLPLGFLVKNFALAEEETP